MKHTHTHTHIYIYNWKKDLIDYHFGNTDLFQRFTTNQPAFSDSGTKLDTQTLLVDPPAPPKKTKQKTNLHLSGGGR